jgi:hypothetical protein
MGTPKILSEESSQFAKGKGGQKIYVLNLNLRLFLLRDPTYSEYKNIFKYLTICIIIIELNYYYLVYFFLLFNFDLLKKSGGLQMSLSCLLSTGVHGFIV